MLKSSLFFIVLIFAFNISEASVWDGSVATSFAGGTGTQDDPYQIATGTQLAYLNIYMKQGGFGCTSSSIIKGKYFVLTDDIVLNEDTINYPNKWPTIGYDSLKTTGIEQYDQYCFCEGTFDGQGYKIIGLAPQTYRDSIDYGLFYRIDRARIKNINMLAVKAKKIGFADMSHNSYYENVVIQGYFNGKECNPLLFGDKDTLFRIQTKGSCAGYGNGIAGNTDARMRESFSTMSFHNSSIESYGLGNGYGIVRNSYFLRVEDDSLGNALANADTIKNSYYANVSGARDNKVYFPSSSYALFDWTHLFRDSLSSVQLLTISPGRRLNMKSRAAVDSLNSGLDSLVWAYDSCGINYGYPYLIHNPPYGKNTVCGSPSSSSAASGSSSSSAESSSSEPPTAVYAGGQPRYSVSVIGSVIRVDNVRDVNVRLFDPLGNLIARKAVYGTGSVYFTVGGAGMYLLRIGGRTENVRVR